MTRNNSKPLCVYGFFKCCSTSHRVHYTTLASHSYGSMGAEQRLLILINADVYRRERRYYTKLLIYHILFEKLFYPRHKGRSFKNNLLVGTVGVPQGQSSHYYNYYYYYYVRAAPEARGMEIVGTRTRQMTPRVFLQGSHIRI